MGRIASFSQRQSWREDISGPQRRALCLLKGTATGGAYVSHLYKVSLQTLRALHRLGLIWTDTPSEVVQMSTYVHITASGRESVADQVAVLE